MKIPLTALLCLLTTVVIPQAAEPSARPSRFRAAIGGFLGTPYRVELRDGVLDCTTTGRGAQEPKHTTVKPTEAQWLAFRRTLDEVDVWRWHASYPSHGIMDGTQWLSEIAFADRAIRTEGSNNYPNAAGEPNEKPETTAAFNRFLEAVRTLTGGQGFR
ncbi:MAG: hypothetical protein ACR2NX_13425 [Chthoniobacterales bacterium]